MTKTEYIKAHETRNPKLQNDDEIVSLSAASLKRLLGEAFDKGYEHGSKTSDSIAKLLGNLGSVTGR